MPYFNKGEPNDINMHNITQQRDPQKILMRCWEFIWGPHIES